MSDKMKIMLGIGGFILVVLLGVFIFLYMSKDRNGGIINDQNDELFNIEDSESPIVSDDPLLDNLIEEENSMNQITDFDTLEVNIKKEGSGTEAKVGNTVVVHYEGSLTNGSLFDSSYERDTPFSFKLGEGMVITGWEEGVLGMKVGEVRELRIPSSMGYGEAGAGEQIPPSAGLIFTVELLDIK